MRVDVHGSAHQIMLVWVSGAVMEWRKIVAPFECTESRCPLLAFVLAGYGVARLLVQAGIDRSINDVALLATPEREARRRGAAEIEFSL